MALSFPAETDLAQHYSQLSADLAQAQNLEAGAACCVAMLEARFAPRGIQVVWDADQHPRVLCSDDQTAIQPSAQELTQLGQGQLVLRRQGERVLACFAPLRARAELRGWLYLEHPLWNEDSALILTLITGQVAPVLAMLDDTSQTSERVSQLRTLNDIARLLSGVLDLGTLLDAIVPNGSRVRVDRTAPAPLSTQDVRTFEHIDVAANGGDDTITAANGLATLAQLTLDGGAANDAITGGDGADALAGGDGNDRVTGGRGNDTALLGAGDDLAAWNPGDGSDTIDGQADHDTLRFNAANIAEQLALANNNGRLRLTRDVANIVMDTDDLEAVALNTLGGADTITIADLTGTDVTTVTPDLAGSLGGSAGDAAVDNVVVTGTNGDDAIAVAGSSGSAAVTGLAARVDVAHPEPTDRLTIDTLAGADTVDSSALAAGTIALTVN